MWTVGVTVEIKLRFRDGLVWTVGLTVKIKLCFLDGLVWTVGLTVERRDSVKNETWEKGLQITFLRCTILYLFIETIIFHVFM